MLNPCRCGRAVRLRAMKVTIDRRRGVGHWIEHVDGTDVGTPSCTTASKPFHCVELKPYPKATKDQASSKLIERWQLAATPIGAAHVNGGTR